jgi:4-aminobutyrate aminotransferase
MGKAIANGFPLSAVGAGRELFGQWPPGSHGTTFGGNPVACAACAATVEALADVLPQVDKLSEHALERLDDLQQRHRRIGDVRGMGLMIGIELADEDRTPRPDWLTEVRRDALERGMLLLSCGPDENVMRFLPPLNATIDELDQGIDIIDQSFAATED